MSSIYVKPAAGRQIGVPFEERHLAAIGEYVEDSLYWRNRLMTGAVTLATPPGIARARALVDRVAESLHVALGKAQRAHGNPEVARAALEAFEAEAEPVLHEAAEHADTLTDDERAQVDAYALAALTERRATLERLAAPPPPGAEPVAPAKGRGGRPRRIAK